MNDDSRHEQTIDKDPLGRGLGAKPYIYTMLSIAGILAFFLIWELLVRSGLVSGKYFTPPTQIIALFVDKLTNINPDGSTIQFNILQSLKVAISGLLLGMVLGIPLGLLMGWYKAADRFVRPLFEILRPIPPIAWIPLTILWLGIGLKAKAFIIFFAAFIPCLINSYTGIKQTNQTLINVARTCGAPDFEVFIKVGIPSSLPIMFAGIRVALGAAWSTLVAAEMLAANTGLGFMILMGRSYGRVDLILLGMVVIGLIGAIFTGSLAWLEKRIIKWRPT